MTDGSGQTTWGYDALDRLTSASYPNGDAVSYGYDAVGNRTSLTVNGNTTTNTFDAADRLTASGTTTYGYDANGNQTSTTVDGVTTTHAYDSLNRLTSVTSGGSTLASYSYNGDGLRTSKTVGGITTSFTWDPTGLGTVIADGDSYVCGLGLIGRITAGGTRTYATRTAWAARGSLRTTPAAWWGRRRTTRLAQRERARECSTASGTPASNWIARRASSTCGRATWIRGRGDFLPGIRLSASRMSHRVFTDSST
jgi:YD repeat-containing protein